MIKEYAVGNELTQEEVKQKLEAGHILITRDGTERAMIYGRKYASWQIKGRLQNILCFLTDFNDWFIMEREEWPRKEIATKDNTDTRMLNRAFFR